MDLTKYKNKSRILLIKSPNYKLKDYLNIKHVYQKHIKKFHKRHVKLITKIDNFSEYQQPGETQMKNNIGDYIDGLDCKLKLR